MFWVFQSEKRRLRKAARNWLYLAERVYHFRKDELNKSELDRLSNGIAEMKSQLKRKDDADGAKLKYAVDVLEGHLKLVGGAFYPRSSIGEYVDFLFMGAILYLGVTAFFMKPFLIPTSSMYPTFYGMTTDVWRSDDEKPGGVNQLIRLLALGSARYEVEAPANGELLIPVQLSSSYGASSFSLMKSIVPRRRFLILPGKGIGHWFEVGGETVELKTPMDFTIEEDVLREAWFPDSSSFYDVIRTKLQTRQYKTRTITATDADGKRRTAKVAMVRSGKYFKKGDSILSFDILSGDRLLVDRISYHFTSPKVGDGLVFLTENIPELNEDKFYIKRLAGTPGDTLEIRDGMLLVNEEPAQGSVAFGLNANRFGDYRGYQNRGNLDVGRKISIPEDSYYALGDNSYFSADSRLWNFVPESEIIGKPVVIFYPFTKRLGLSK